LSARKRVVIGLLGPRLDHGTSAARWSSWRPTVALFQQADQAFDRLELLCQARYLRLARQVAEDVQLVSPDTEVQIHTVPFEDPWDLEGVFDDLYGWAESQPFDPASEDYFVHITTGTHVAQICLFLLTEARQLPGRLLQASPPARGAKGREGTVRVLDLDLGKYDRVARRHAERRASGLAFLKAGIRTRSALYNALIAEIEHVAGLTRAPLLLTGPTGAGKTRLARRIYALKQHRNLVAGPWVEVNCATLRGDGAMSTLFGHVRGAFTGAGTAREGLLRQAHEGVLFLDEIGELGLDEQAMLLHAIEEKRFLPMGADVMVSSDFQLIAGTNRNLYVEVRAGRFREDLLARINLWHWALPGLRERIEDLSPNLDFELDAFLASEGRPVRFSREARAAFEAFARGASAEWSGNFRDLNAAVTRMATLAPAGRIDVAGVEAEQARLLRSWGAGVARSPAEALLYSVMGDRVESLDRFDRAQLADVLWVCQRSRSLSAAGRVLFAVSRAKKTSSNDSDRLRKYLARVELSWKGLPFNQPV
jgi:transcriptional regulatory protein RtcR